MLGRIKKLIDSENLSSGSFADEIGVGRSSLTHIMNGRNNPSLDFVIKTLQRFPDINPEWLLLGKGDMYTNVNKEDTARPEPALSHDLFSSISESVQEVEDVDEPEISPDFSDNEEVVIKNVEKYVSQILIFYSDSTYQMFKPEK